MSCKSGEDVTFETCATLCISQAFLQLHNCHMYSMVCVDLPPGPAEQPAFSTNCTVKHCIEVKRPRRGRDWCANGNERKVQTTENAKCWHMCSIAAGRSLNMANMFPSAEGRGQLWCKGQPYWNLSNVRVWNICCLTRQESQICICTFNVHCTELFRQGGNKHLYTIQQGWRRAGQHLRLWHPGSN